MRIGLIARADKTGLSIQTWCFWRNMKPSATLVVDVGHLMGVPPDMSWFEGDENVVRWRPNFFPSPWPTPEGAIDEFLEKVDCVFSVETFYNTYLPERARQLGKRTVLQPNYEHLVHMNEDNVPEPDCFALPTDWHEHDIRQKLHGREIVHLPVPVDRELLQYRPRENCSFVLHTAGTVAEPDRNGTEILVEAMRLVNPDVRCAIFSQRPMQRIHNMEPPLNTSVTDNAPVPRFWEVYDGFDVLVLPRRFGGLCLPAQEALACGMPVIGSLFPRPGGERFFPVVEVGGKVGETIYSKAPIETLNADPRHIAEEIDKLNVPAASLAADDWADAHSWAALKPKYWEVLSG